VYTLAAVVHGVCLAVIAASSTDDGIFFNGGKGRAKCLVHRCCDGNSFTPNTYDSSNVIDQIFANAKVLVGCSVSLWFVFWSIRRGSEVDEKLDSTAQLTRWAVVVFGYLAGSVPGPRFAIFKVIVLLLGLAFLCWPNFAYHLTNLFRRRNDAPQNSP